MRSEISPFLVLDLRKYQNNNKKGCKVNSFRTIVRNNLTVSQVQVPRPAKRAVLNGI